ncbi:septation protein A [Bordetella genomosp. 10]|uniref:Inner membrane-spanning protein YciB n=1 Tax=Bordetella genomosp. 10 TaxID=1416804 RepID=A0A261SMP1_9BORD|nr:septation protein A [Bordetella genomosp. 10]OZI38698.1 septation protein A [Bordetella genomosp. 10]
MKKFLFDFFPLLLFFIAYYFAGIYVATGVSIAASIGQIVWLRMRGHRIEGMHWVNLVVIVVFGGATLILHNDAFIKWKPTVLYWLFGLTLLAGRFIFGRNLVRRMLDKQIQLPVPIWDRLNLAWGIFFLLAGALNLYVAFSGHFTEAQWVSFKAFGLTVLMLAFVVAQSLWLGRYIQPPEPGEDAPSEKN